MLKLKGQSFSATLSTGRAKVRVPSAGVAGAVSQSDLDIGQGVGVDIALESQTIKKLMTEVVAKLLLPANMINDHLRLQVGVC